MARKILIGSVLRTLRDWRLAGHHAVLATVVRTWGSSPGPKCPIMALRADGAVCRDSSGCDRFDRREGKDPGPSVGEQLYAAISFPPNL